MHCAQRLAIATTLTFAALVSPSAADGVKVHGHWTIELKNPDGSVAAHHEFENALVNQGARVLATLLQGNAPRGFWLVQLGAATGGGPCGPNATPCFLTEPGYPIQRALLSVDLMANGEAVKLSGSVTADLDGDIALVTTTQAIGNQSFVFSQRTLAAPIHVVAGQSISVSVVFSFS